VHPEFIHHPDIIDPQRGGSIRKKKRKKAGSEDPQSTATDESFVEGALAYDPNEPLYCTCRYVADNRSLLLGCPASYRVTSAFHFCRQISFGNMIACENQDCSIEWFHFGCVGLKAEVRSPSCCCCHFRYRYPAIY
jgi:hypothetical protein